MKKLLSLLLVLSLCLAFVACGADNVNYDTYSVAFAAPKIEASYRDYSDEGFKAFLEKLDLFASKLTYEVYSDSDKQTNICISPVSVYMALALTVECTEGDSRQEILDAVGVTYDEVSRFTSLLYALANRELDYEELPEGEVPSAFLELANSIWADDGVALREAGVKNLAENFNCDLFRVDFASGEGERAIASYIKDKTHGLIDGALQLPATTLITLINTFYLKDAWNDMGKDLEFTGETYDFRNADGSTEATRLLKGYYFAGKAYEGEGYTSFFTKTYNGFSLKFLVPKEGHSLEEVFTAENIYAINNVSDYGYKDDVNYLLHHTRVLFPEYEASYGADISGVLQEEFGIRSAYDVGVSDFSGITEETVVLNKIVHKCVLKVDKRGIEGAAVTASVGDATGRPEYVKVYHDFVVDRAFGFVITDGYGTVLFSGAVNTLD